MPEQQQQEVPHTVACAGLASGTAAVNTQAEPETAGQEDED